MKYFLAFAVCLATTILMWVYHLNRVRTDVCFNQAAKFDYCVSTTFQRCDDYNNDPTMCDVTETALIAQGLFKCDGPVTTQTNCQPTGQSVICYRVYPCSYSDTFEMCEQSLNPVETQYANTYVTVPCK